MDIYKDIFDALPLPAFLLEPSNGYYLIREVNKAYFNSSSPWSENLNGKTIPEAFQENPQHLGTSWEVIHNAINSAFTEGQSNVLETIRYDLLNCETNEFEEAYWQLYSFPIRNQTTGLVEFILLMFQDKTLVVLNQRQW